MLEHESSPKVTIYFPENIQNLNLNKTDKKALQAAKEKARKNEYKVTQGKPEAENAEESEYQIIFTKNPEDYQNDDPKRIVLCAKGPGKKIALQILQEIVAVKTKKLTPQKTEASPLIEEEIEEGSSKKNSNPFKSIEIETYLKEILGDHGWTWSNTFGALYTVLFNAPVSGGGTFPFTIFNSEYAKKVFGNSEGLIIWSTVSSAAANYAISLRSLAQLPGLILTEMPNVFRKVTSEFHKHGIKAYDSYKILALTAIVMVINAFSIYAGFTLANQSTKDFSDKIDYHNQAVLSALTITEVVGTVALVLRATMNKFVDWSLNDLEKMASTLRGLLFKNLNALITEENKLNEVQLTKLASGNLENRTTRTWGLYYLIQSLRGKNPYASETTSWSWRDVLTTAVQYGSYALLGAVAIYSVAYGILAADAVTDSFSLQEFLDNTDPYASFVASMNFASKFMLLGSATLNLSSFVKSMISDNIITTNADISNAVKSILYAVIFTGAGWNTWLSASKITAEFLWDNFIFDVVVGIGATAGINYLDQCNVFLAIIQQAKNFLLYSLPGRTPESDIDGLIKLQIQKLAKMSPREFAKEYIDRYGRKLSEEEIETMRENLGHFEKALEVDKRGITFEEGSSSSNSEEEEKRITMKSPPKAKRRQKSKASINHVDEIVEIEPIDEKASSRSTSETTGALVETAKKDSLSPNERFYAFMTSITEIKVVIGENPDVSNMKGSLPHGSKYGKSTFFAEGRRSSCFPCSSSPEVNREFNI